MTRPLTLINRIHVGCRCLAATCMLVTLRQTAGDAGSAKSDHWCFKQAVRPVIPQIRLADWPRNPVDQFILARLEADALAPAPEADRRTLVRRLSFDLTGLPPTPEDADRFVRDDSLSAYEALVDRLLDSPRYGERQARRWLDLVHYGESHGYDKDKPRWNAWPYRDYVIRAFNCDKPYSRFVEEQLAGDVLFPDEPDAIAATGFIAAGPWDYVGHVELPESKTDGLIARYNDRDDMVMTTMSTFQSLTVHCARCHDHKFDPISQEEYYRLQSVFAGVDRASRSYDIDPVIARQRRELLVERKRLQHRLDELIAVAAKISSTDIERLSGELNVAKERLKSLDKAGKESPANGYHSAISSTPNAVKWVQVDLGKVTTIGEVRLIPARPTDFTDTPGFGFPARFFVEASDTEESLERHVLFDTKDANYSNPRDQAVIIPASNVQARYVRVTAKKLWERTQDYVFALAELQIWAGTNNIALGANVSALDSIETGRWGKARLVDGFDSRKSLEDPSKGFSQGQSLESEIARLESERETLVQAQLDSETRSELNELRRKTTDLELRLSKLPAPQSVYAASSDFKPEGSFKPPGTPREVHLLKRGDVKRPDRLMAPGSLACVPGVDPELKPADTGEGFRRAALARWITAPGNMLTRRSIVNRVWLQHFGRGIVDTPNDFGHMGSSPTHPELLDWLAFWFLDNGESFKKLDRLIVTSATYRQSSTVRSTNGERVDVDNRYLWRMNLQRLDAESFRDTLLFVSGTLDQRMSGPSDRQFGFKDDHSPVYDYTAFDVESPASNRRSVYRFIVRSVPDPFLECLDAADPSLLTARRNITLTALQALATLNNPFVLHQCENLRHRLESRTPSAEKQITEAYRLVLNRVPSTRESRWMTDYAARHGLANACRVLFNCNEFMFVD